MRLLVLISNSMDDLQHSFNLVGQHSKIMSLNHHKNKIYDNHQESRCFYEFQDYIRQKSHRNMLLLLVPSPVRRLVIIKTIVIFDVATLNNSIELHLYHCLKLFLQEMRVLSLLQQQGQRSLNTWEYGFLLFDWLLDYEIKCCIEQARSAFLRFKKVLTYIEFYLDLRVRFLRCYV